MLRNISPVRWSAIIAYSTTSIVLNSMPAIITVLGRALHWGDAQLGYFASADIMGYTAGTLLAPLTMKWRSPRLTALTGIIVVLMADLASAATTAPTIILALRGVGGLGAGFAAGATWYVMSLSHQAANNGLATAGQTGLGFLAIVAIPLLAHAAGWRLVFIALGAMAIPALLVVHRLPAGRWKTDATAHVEPRRASGRRLAPWLATVGVAAYFLGQGALWTYLGLVGTAAHLTQAAIDLSLDACAAGLFLGSLLILVIPAHAPRGTVVGITLSLTLLSIVGLRSGVAPIFISCAAAFGLLYPIFPAFQFESIAQSSIAAGVMTLAASMAGYSCGPLIAGKLIEHFGYASLHWLAGTGCALALLTLIPLLVRKNRRT